MLKQSLWVGSISMCLALSVSAEELPLSYSYIDVSYQTGELLDDDFDGVGIAASVALHDSIFLIAKYAMAASKDEYYTGDGFDDIEFSQLNIGLGVHVPIVSQTDFISAISYVRNELDFAGLNFEGTGYLINMGFRTKPNKSLELMAVLDYANVEDETETGYSFSARVYPVEKVSIGLSYGSADDLDTLSLGIRFDI